MPEDRAAGAVEVAGHGVQRVEQERHQRAEAPEAGAGAPVGGGAVGGGEVARQLRARARRGCRSGPRSASGGCSRASALELARALGRCARRKIRSASPSSKITASIDSSRRRPCPGGSGGARTGARSRCGAGSTTTTRSTLEQLLAHARGRQHRAVRDERVGSQHQQEARALEVGDRHQQRRAVEQCAGGEAVVHVLRAGRVVVRRAERVEEALDPERVGVRERAWVSHVPGHLPRPGCAAAGRRCRPAPRPRTPARSGRPGCGAAAGSRGRDRSGSPPSRSPWDTRSRATAGDRGRVGA